MPILRFFLLFLSVFALMCCKEVNPIDTNNLQAPPFTVSSSSFISGGLIDEKYTFPTNGHSGSNISPQLSWTSAPAGTVSFVLIMDDPYAPGAFWSHWILFNLPSTTTSLIEGFNATVPTGTQGKISSGAQIYEGPYAPSGEPLHNYHFRIYALDKVLDLASASATRTAVMAAIAGHILANGEIVGTHPGH